MLRFQRPLGTCSGFALTQAEWPWVDHGSCELSLGFSIWMGRAGLADFQGAVQQWCGFAHRRRMDRGYLFPTTFSNEPNCAVLAMSTCSERDVRNSTPSLFWALPYGERMLSSCSQSWKGLSFPLENCLFGLSLLKEKLPWGKVGSFMWQNDGQYMALETDRENLL